jgi:hypothetical protein
MNRKLKALGLALVVVFAMSAVVASAASAKQLHSGSTTGITHLTGTQIGATNQLHLENGTPVKCTTALFDATYNGTTVSELTVTPTYSGCTAAGQKAEIHMNGCTYTITTPAGSADAYTATVHLVCPAGKDVVITVPTAGCTVTIQAQTPTVPTIDLTDVTTAVANQDDILLKSTVEGVHYTTVGGGVCGAAGKGKLTGEVTVKAYENAAHTIQRDLAIF